MALFSILWQTTKNASPSLPLPWPGGADLSPKRRRRIGASSTPLSLSLFPSSSGSGSICMKPLESLKPRLLLVPSPQHPRSITTTTALCTSSSPDPIPSNDADQKPPSPFPWMRKLRFILDRLALLLTDNYLRAPSWIRNPRELFGLLLFSVLFLAYEVCTSRNTVTKEVPYSDLVSGIKLGNVASVDFEEDSSYLSFRKIRSSDEEEDASSKEIRYQTRKIVRDEKFLLGLLHDNNIICRSVRPPYTRLLFSFVNTGANVLVTVVLISWISDKILHDTSYGSRKNRTGTRQTVSFDDVQGVESAKEELMEVVNCLRGTLDYKKLGAKLPAGILLVGPPGTGKTLLARAVAGEAGVPFFSVSASEFMELYVGRGASRVRDLFKEARKEAPAVVFIDELDAVGTERNGSSGEKDQTLNQLLTEMDGFDSNKQVIVLAATNRPGTLDPALLRPGRFSRKVYVGEPDLEGRKKILAVHLRGVPLEDEMEVVCESVASLTVGFVGADLANIVNEAALLSVRRGRSLVAQEHIMEAIEREKNGKNEHRAKAAQVVKSLVKLFSWLDGYLPWHKAFEKNKN
ncbi:ATP-dependent zinc metalloprotease FTSH-like protein [Rhynchospora pubera]|uniref:ATP-dependent zinc metalloprotease FTSH-like protein n=1 Tax=Rhynchospora pubera TaxID=906938 RepID=A0AAV8CNR4_9POAL|nr:ATP-dependent zinc metalloprotease FTSH-like protein [Rhynchospora pubera]